MLAPLDLASLEIDQCGWQLCRTYMVGGGSARGLPNDTVVVYTPVGEGSENVILPYGSFVNQKFKATGEKMRQYGTRSRAQQLLLILQIRNNIS